MKKSEITDSILNKRVYLTKSELLHHWGNLIFTTFIIGMMLIVNIENEITTSVFPSSLLFLLGALVISIFHKITSRTFEIWNIEVSEKQFKDACEATSRYLSWHLINHRKDYLKANKTAGFSYDGIRITAIRTQKQIFFNSMIEPSYRSMFFSANWNRKNKIEFKKQLIKVVNGEDVVKAARQFQQETEMHLWNEPEWSAKNILKRIIGYSLSILFVALGVWLISSITISGIVAGMIFVGYSFSYIYFDIKVLREKKK